MFNLNSKIEELKKVGPSYLKKLQKLKIRNIRDLFFHFPHRYEDLSKITPIEELSENQKAMIQGVIKKIKLSRTNWRRMKLIEAIVEDKSGSIKVVWFNQAYLAKTLSEGQKVNLAGKAKFDGKNFILSNPVYEIVSQKELTHTGRLVPVYPETAGLTSRYLRYLIKPLLPLAYQIEDFLPYQIKREFKLINLSQALTQIHFPQNEAYLKASIYRLSFDELFLTQLSILKEKKKMKLKKAIVISFDQELIKSFVEKLPFKLTDDQRLAAWEIFQDLATEKPMNRLLNGDVGSGKTIVTMMAALTVAKAGYQAALMAPTEILAKQHYETFKKFLRGNKIKLGLLTSSTSKQIKDKVSKGQLDIIIGTHALIQEKISFKNLALAIVDEQHRFGVLQRAALQKKTYQIKDGTSFVPHLLSMTATPIPRTLSLTICGDLDISLIKQMPQGRKEVITKLILPQKRQESYDFIKKQIKQKKQVFVICPLIDPSDKLAVKSVSQEYQRLSEQVFPEFKIAMLHGKLKSKEKEEIMEKFKKRELDILVATSVIEVGVDIPKATVMIIEGAERFGLAQLHQFRGRIGRGKDQSYCFLFIDSSSQSNNQRLRALTKCNDGFKLAEKDLKIRGPGDFIGSRQWGLPNLTMASLNDLELIKKARQAAQQVLEKNLLSENLEEKLKEFEGFVHLE